jgi:hypothetical protein
VEQVEQADQVEEELVVDQVLQHVEHLILEEEEVEQQTSQV